MEKAEENIKHLPEVIVICLDSEEPNTTYPNIRVEHVSMQTQGLHGVFGIILGTEAPYICFADSGRSSKPDKIMKMVEYLERVQDAGSVLCRNEYVDEDGEHITGMIKMWSRYLEDMGEAVNGTGLLELSLLKEDNLYGNLECCMLRREIFINKDFLLNYMECTKEEEKLLLMWECLYGMKVGMLHEELVQSKQDVFSVGNTYQDFRSYTNLRDKVLQAVYKQISYPRKQLPSYYRCRQENFDRRSIVEKVKKEITFFHEGRAEYFNVKPIAEEAEKRGYQVSFTEDLGKPAEIGVYCSHVGCMYRENYKAKLSVLLLHDMTQGELDWPNLWNEEPWNEFDIGILPGNAWADRWKQCSGFDYAHPRLGVYEAGYPKGDYVNNPQLLARAEEIKKELNLKYDYTVFYVPSWENDGKEHEFVKALCDLPVNILIKQGAWEIPVVANAIKEMRELHEGKYDNVYYIDAKENIMNVYPICDLVVSDESGAMTEALLFGKPSIAVMDWTIPDTNPPRLVSVPIDYVYKCKKAQLKEQVESVLQLIAEDAETMGTDPFFSHVGETGSIIMDLIEYYTGESHKDDCLSTELCPIHQLHGLWD